MAPSALDLAQPQGAAERPHRARKHRPGLAAPVAALRRGRHACAQVRNARGARGQRARQVAVRRGTAEAPVAPICRPGRCRGRARPHRSRQDAVGGFRARAQTRACQRLPARDRAQVGNRHHRPQRPQEHLARAGARTSTWIIAAAAARSPAGPRSSRSPAPGPSTSAPTRSRPPTSCSSRCPCRAWCRADLHVPCPSSPASKASTCRCGPKPSWNFQHRRDPERHHRHRRRAGTGVAAVAGGDAAAHRWRASGARLRQGRAPASTIAPSVLVWGDSRVQFTGSWRTLPRAPRVPAGPSTCGRPADGSAPSRRTSRS